jgi:hypothetical protein
MLQKATLIGSNISVIVVDYCDPITLKPTAKKPVEGFVNLVLPNGSLGSIHSSNIEGYAQLKDRIDTTYVSEVSDVSNSPLNNTSCPT